MIQAFEFTFEQSWKSIQKLAGAQGVVVASPKLAYTFAMQTGWILQQDEPLWLKMMEDRNLTSYTYREDIARDVLLRITQSYLRLFEDLLAKL